MRSLDVLITSSYYWPETAGNAPYVTGVAEHFRASGHRVTVTTGFAHYPEWRSSAGRRLAQRETKAGVEIRRRWHYVPGAQSAATRGLYEGSLFALGLTALPRRRPDVVLGVAPTLAGAALARTAATLYRRPYGLVFQDLLGLGAEQSGIEGGRGVAGLVQRTELALARGARVVGVIAEGFRPYFEANGVDPARIRRLRNWSQELAPAETVAETRARLGWSTGEIVCLHAGNMGHKQGLENVLEAAARTGNGGVRIVLAGDGNERGRLEAEAARRALRNVEFLPPQAPGLYESMLRAADVLLVNQRGTVGEMSLASKLTSYFAAGRPVIGALAGTSETGRELVAAGAGVLVSPDDPQALADAIAETAGDLEAARSYGENARRYAAEHLSRAAVMKAYDDLLQALAAR